MATLLPKFPAPSGFRALRLFLTPDITSTIPDTTATPHLIVPTNERFQGTRFTPSEASAAGLRDGIVYPEQTVDGLVTMVGGAALAAELAQLAAAPTRGHGPPCHRTAAYGLELYASLHHVAPPFFDADDQLLWSQRLTAAWRAAFESVFADGEAELAVAPLLGAGARGAPADLAAMALREATRDFALVGEPRELWIGVQDDATAADVELVLMDY